ncbi:MAG: hypothetical protein AAFZ15_19940, partial [Bacteroidota bacterium]
FVQLSLIGYSVYFFFYYYGTVDFSKPTYLSFGIINIAILLYNAGSLFIFMFANIMVSANVSEQIQFSLWLINGLLFLIFQVLIFISLWITAFRNRNS